MRARELMTTMVPAILATLSKQSTPDEAFRRFDRFITALPTGVQPLSLFQHNPALLERIAIVVGGAPALPWLTLVLKRKCWRLGERREVEVEPLAMAEVVVEETMDPSVRFAERDEARARLGELKRDERRALAGEKTLDAIRARFGAGAVTSGRIFRKNARIDTD